MKAASTAFAELTVLAFIRRPPVLYFARTDLWFSNAASAGSEVTVHIVS